MVDDFSEALAHLVALLESALSEPVSLFEVLLSEGSCKGQHNSKIDSHSQKGSGSLSWLTVVPLYSEFSMVVFPKHHQKVRLEGLGSQGSFCRP